ncbi:MAG: Uncharacterised protein [Flavobacteriia bacterium]|nr:MAG: Uncharacterised protein [Flavobacteriia bacterium]
MRILRHGPYFINSNAWVQIGVQAVHQLRSIDRVFRVKMRPHLAGMYPRVRSSCADHFRGLSQQMPHGPLKFFLDRGSVGLFLPSMKRCALVMKPNEVPIFQPSWIKVKNKAACARSF